MKKELGILLGSIALSGCMSLKPQLPENHRNVDSFAAVMVCAEIGKISEADSLVLGEYYVRSLSSQYSIDTSDLKKAISNEASVMRLYFRDNPDRIDLTCNSYITRVPSAQSYLMARERKERSNQVAMNNFFGAINNFGKNFNTREYTYRPMNLPAATINGMPQNQPTNIMVNTKNGWVRKSCIKNNNAVMCN